MKKRGDDGIRICKRDLYAISRKSNENVIPNIYFLHSICSTSKRLDMVKYKAKIYASLLPDAEKLGSDSRHF